MIYYSYTSWDKYRWIYLLKQLEIYHKICIFKDKKKMKYRIFYIRLSLYSDRIYMVHRFRHTTHIFPLRRHRCKNQCYHIYTLSTLFSHHSICIGEYLCHPRSRMSYNRNRRSRVPTTTTRESTSPPRVPTLF